MGVGSANQSMSTFPTKGFPDSLSLSSGLEEFNAYISDKTYISGHTPTAIDAEAFRQFNFIMSRLNYPHAYRYFKHLASFTDAERSKFPARVVRAATTATTRPALPDLTKITRVPKPPHTGVSKLITSALPYVNNEPHLGNIIGCVLSADVYARYCRLKGHNTLYVCGTDEYGTATETKAFEEGVSPKEICDRYHEVHKAIYQWFHISFDHFGRTSTQHQTRIAQHIFLKAEENDLLLEQETEQLYCPKYDKFLADRYVEGTCPKCGYDDARGDQCDACGALLNPTELIRPHYKYDKDAEITTKKTKHLYLDLPRLEEQLNKWVSAAGPGKWSENTIQVTKSWLRDGLKPRCITRDLKWGTPVPREGYESKVFYVWFDAPIGYISITSAYAEKVFDVVGKWEEWWKNPDNVSLVQFMGKDNIPFHTVIFPSSLLATKENWTLLDRISTTEYLNYEDGKFSKSRGVGVFGSHCGLTGIPADIWRYYLLSNRPETSDSEFSWKAFQLCNNSELLANFGNFCNRALTFLFNSLGGIVPSCSNVNEADLKLQKEVNALIAQWDECLDQQHIRDATRHVMSISRLGNVYLQDNQPWETIKHDADRAKTVLSVCAQLVATLSVVAHPFMPGVSHHLRYQLNLPPLIPADPEPFTGADLTFKFDAVPAGHKINKPFTLFDKLENAAIDECRQKFGGGTQQNGQQGGGFEAVLRVGQIVNVADHPDADKLYVLRIDLGSLGERQIVSGLKLHYAAEELQNKRVVVVCNLETAIIKAVESRGMVLCADKKGVFGLLTASDSVPLGTVVLPEGIASAPKADLSIKDFKKVVMKTGAGSAVFFKDAKLKAGNEVVIAEKVGESQCQVR
eukprot:c11748_g1_i1.p1 GENE.c11748_g1_i1~~c11748_g1_i1.p1  ORF type:complete len:857 (-),score=231.80 c11748_g1_i1:139-2709(-)